MGSGEMPERPSLPPVYSDALLAASWKRWMIAMDSTSWARPCPRRMTTPEIKPATAPPTAPMAIMVIGSVIPKCAAAIPAA